MASQGRRMGFEQSLVAKILRWTHDGSLPLGLQISAWKRQMFTNSKIPSINPTQPRKKAAARRRNPQIRWMVLLLVVLIGAFGVEITLQVADGRTKQLDGVLSQLHEIATATLSDAVDQVVGQRGFMSYDMRPISLEKRMVGRAKTVLFGALDPASNQKGNGPLHGIQIIDESGPGDVMVVVTGDLNVTGLGGLMATTAHVRGMSGVVVDGAVRDVDEIKALGLPVFCRSIVPSTMLGRAQSIGRDVPVTCGNVTVSTGDYIVGDRDGVVCIPASKIEEVIGRALEMEATEKKMIPKIYEIKSLQKVVEMFKRI